MVGVVVVVVVRLVLKEVLVFFVCIVSVFGMVFEEIEVLEMVKEDEVFLVFLDVE